MKRILPLKPLLLTAAAFCLVILASLPSFSLDSKFRKEFVETYRQNRFDYLATLVKKNKEIIPGEVRSLIKEAMSPDKSYPERMELLDTAGIMASMYKHWHNDDSLIKEVEVLQKAEMKKEEERQAEAHRWDKSEAFLGNFVMREHEKEAAAKGLSPVVYPHWVHRLFFECKACHQDIFTPGRASNGISQSKILEGRQCGVCHNGKLSFSADEKCERCHIAGLSSEERLRDLTKFDPKGVKEAAERLNTGFSPEKLQKGLPLDRFKSIDWEALRKSGAYVPAKSIDKGAKEKTRDSVIVFEPKMPYIKSVLFSHRTHSSQINCSTCHPYLFKEELGASDVSKTAMGEGRSCGYCHGKVAFKMADCNRCHTGGTAENALKR